MPPPDNQFTHPVRRGVVGTFRASGAGAEVLQKHAEGTKVLTAKKVFFVLFALELDEVFEKRVRVFNRQKK